MENWLEITIIKIGNYSIIIRQALTVLILFIIAYLTIRLLKAYLKRLSKKETIDSGRTQSIFQLTKYFIIVIIISVSLSALGIDITILIASSAALLVGLGLGIQKIFSDTISGIVILVEGTLKVNDIIETEGVVGKVVDIGLRTSKVLTRDDIIIIVPNSLFVNEKVINWTHNKKATRFSVQVPLPYGSKISDINNLLIKLAKENIYIEKTPEPFVRLSDYGDSSLVFEIFFYSTNMFRVENIKSDLRTKAYEELEKNGIHIPFPQRDIHII